MARIVSIEQRILRKNAEVAAENRRYFEEHGAFVVSLASSPGAGKTSLLEAALARLKREVSVGVIEGDLQTDNDARRIEALGVPAVQILTNGTCHLDAQMVQRALQQAQFGRLELLFIENVGNLVCPASYDLGEHLRVVISSVTEGEDKPLKYPAMFRRSEALIFNKIDLLPYLRFDLELACAMALRVNPRLLIFQTSCVTGEGIEDFCQWILGEMARHPAA